MNIMNNMNIRLGQNLLYSVYKTCWCSSGCDINTLKKFQVAKCEQFLRLQIANIHACMQQTQHFQGSTGVTRMLVYH